MRKILNVLAILTACSLIGQADLAHAAKTRKKNKDTCNEVVEENPTKRKGKGSKEEKVAQSDVDKYFKFLKTRLRMPSASEIKDLELPKLSVQQLFGSWGQGVVGSSNQAMRGGMLNFSVNNALLSRDQVEALIDVYYKKLKALVVETNIYPPAFEDFASFLGHEGKDLGLFKALFDKNQGLFLGYNESFKTNAYRWKNLGNFFMKYPDRTFFTPEVKMKLTTDIHESPAIYVGGFVSGQPIPAKMEEALTFLQKESKGLYGKSLPLLIAPAYGLASGLPESLNAPQKRRYVSPETVYLQEAPGNIANINKVALPNRAINPPTGLNKLLSPGETMVVVHPYSQFAPMSSDTEYPSAIVTTGAINETGHNMSKFPIGARISSIHNELGTTSLLVLEKLTGTEQEKVFNLEANFRPRSLPYLPKETQVDLGDGTVVSYPPGFADLNKLYGIDGKVYDLPIYSVIFGDTHYPVTDRSYLENFYRQFIDPKTCLKRTDGKPVDILSIVFNDHFNGDWFSSYTEKDLSAKAGLARDPREYNLELHLRGGAEVQKDLQMAIEKTRGYVPNAFYMHSNHDSDRLKKKLSTGTYVQDVINVAAYTKLKSYQDSKKDAFREYLMNDIGVSYNDHVHVLAPGEPLVISNMAISHGHMGGVFGKPVPLMNRRAAQGSAGMGHTHVAMEAHQIYNAGHAALDLEYAKGWFKQGYQAVIIRTPIHTQVLFYKDGTFYGSSTHGNSAQEFRAGYPYFRELPVDTQQLRSLPGQANMIDQYR